MKRKELILYPKGFTLIGVIVVMVVMAIVAAVAIPSVFLSISLSRENITKEQLKEIQKAIMGSPTLGTYGYVGDMGRFPNNLEELNIQGVQPTWTTTGNFLSIGMGWRGPYLNEEFFTNDYLKDAWNTPYILTVTHYPAQDSTKALVQSYGPDKQINTVDDYFSDVMILKGTLRLIVTIGMTDNIPRSVEADLYYANNGTQCATPIQSEIVTLQGEKGFWSYVSFAPVHHGVHGLLVNAGAIEEVVIVDIAGGIASDARVVVPIGTR
ncbi:MAG: prepilin-type N-terminal cleavage/methylation domain-containing protein [Candidatus Latescibacter sp.]|nr:prepilin-type N-terminal cleavage/methylation domain-containing protein [Candidatus Latescibacter sp.]